MNPLTERRDEHIHANCDCTYAVRVDKYSDAEGETAAEKMNSMRREAERGVDKTGGNGIIEHDGPLKRITAIRASYITEKVRSGEYSLYLSDQSYNKHFEGHKDYERYKTSRALKGKKPQSILQSQKKTRSSSL